MHYERDWTPNGEHWSGNECKDRERGYKLVEGDQSGHYAMASLPVLSADHFLKKHVLKLVSPIFQSSPVQSNVYTFPTKTALLFE